MSKAIENLRSKYVDVIAAALEGEEVLRVGSNEIALPVVDEDGADQYIVITIKVPSGTRDGDPYDGYAMAEEYQLKCKAKAEKAQEAAAKKAAKIARDEQKRAEKAAARAKEKE